MNAPGKPLPDFRETSAGAESAHGPLTVTLADLSASVLRHWILVLIITLVGAAGGFVLAKRITPHYKAAAALISDATLSAISDGAPREGGTIIDPSVTPTIVESIGSPVVLARALGTLPPALLERLKAESKVKEHMAPTSDPAAAQELEQAMLVQFMSQTVQVTNSGRSYVVYVNYTSTDPELASGVANAVAQAYLDYRTELKRGGYSEILGSLKTEIGTLKSELQTAEGTAQTMREQVRLLAARTEALAGRDQEAAIAQSSGLYARQREAEREAEATASVYERLLLNQREIQSRLNTPELDVQLFALAPIPLRPSGFNLKPVLLVLGLVAGFCLGASIALLRDRLETKRRRSA